MIAAVRWREKRDRDNKLVPDCWVTECGYTVAKCRIDTRTVYQVTAPGDRAPLAHPATKDDVLRVINIDKELRNDRG